MEEGQTINISQYLTNRLVAETSSVKISQIEMSYLSDIFKDDFYLSERFENADDVLNSIQLLDRNFFYDIYKFSYNGGSYIIKIGESDDINIFNKEKKALQDIEELNLSPKHFNSSSSETYSYLLASFEHSQSTKELGLSYTFKYIEKLSSVIAKIHNKTKQEENEKDLFLDSIYSYGEHDQIFSSEEFDALIDQIKLDDYKYEDIKNLLNEIESSISIQIPSNGETFSALCHTNINPSCILHRQGKIKLFNFYQSFYLHPAWDLAFASYKLQLNKYPIHEKRFLDAYHDESFLKENQYSYTLYKQLAYKIILHQLVSKYFYVLTVPNEEMGNFLSLVQEYDNIRDSIQDEFLQYIPMLDKMFFPFLK